MCDYSLYNVKSRPANVGDKLWTRDFNGGTRGFAASEDPTVAVCVLPGTELALSQEGLCAPIGIFGWKEKLSSALAIFRQVNKDEPYRHHDALEFPDGRVVLLTNLREDQEATDLQLPAVPTTAVEEEVQKRASYAG